ncbi:MAG: restriction endonuclease [Anaerolineae bacterium]|nr:restriction endonuclease [Anaerolineae bacterium]
MPQPITENTLFYGDNLTVLREHIPNEAVDLIYLDPPFNSNRSYNVLFQDESGLDSEAQITAFEDTWHWGITAEKAYRDIVLEGPEGVSKAIGAMLELIGRNQMMAYLVMMTARLIELHRVLKPTGSLWLHCDPTASHYLKMVLDSIFGTENFKNEIIWQRTNARSTAGRWPRIHDTLLYYTKTDDFTFHSLKIRADKAKLPHTLITGPDGKKYQTYELTAPGITQGGESGQPWRGFDPAKMGRHWANLHAKMDEWDAQGIIHWPKEGGFPRRRARKPFDPESRKVTAGDIWTDIDRINQAAKERLGYPTQKPLALLERIIEASSSPGDWVLDPFCGCGTAIVAAQQLGRRWIGIDITHLSVALQKYRLEDMFGLAPKRDYAVVGEPNDPAGAQQLAQENRFQFEWWALSLVQARPTGGTAGSRKGKKGADSNIDGVITFIDDADALPKRVLVQVKSGRVGRGDIEQLRGTVERENAAMGVFITLQLPTELMKTEALSAGYYHSPGWMRDYPRIQILTIEELLAGAQASLPPAQTTFKQAPRAEMNNTEQPPLGL